MERTKTTTNGKNCWNKRAENINKSNGDQAGNSNCEDDEQGQLQDVIGHFGKYQLLIFVFKILIGLTSAFNNLSVTFFAPYEFVSYWCADSGTTTIATTPATLGAVSSVGFNGTTHFIMAGGAASVESLVSKIHSTGASFDDGSQWSYYQNILNGFLFSEERKFRHTQLNQNYDTPRNLRKECYYMSPVDNRSHKCTSFRFDTGVWISTIIDEWNLVCDRSWFVSMTQSLYMSGFIISYLFIGYISDRFGRWRTLMLGALAEALSGFGCAFSSSVKMFMIFRFLLGLGNAGRTTSSYLIMIEWAGPKWRMHISTMGSLGWIIGYCSMPWITMYFLHFRHMQLFCCFYELVFIIWLLRLPESPRWLLTHKRFDEAYKVLLMAAKFNGLIIRKEDSIKSTNNVYKQQQKALDCCSKDEAKSSENKNQQVKSNQSLDKTTNAVGAKDEQNSDKSLKPYTIEEFNIKFKRLVNSIYAKKFSANEHKLSLLDLFRWKNLRNYALILWFVWAANSFIYYGIALRVGDFGGRNLFISFTIAGLTELPSLAFTILCMKFLPRKTTNLFLFTTTGLLCIMQVPLKYYEIGWLQQTTAMLTKLFNSCSFTAILYQTMELFPTSIRQTAYSSCSLAGRIGSILAPFIKELAQLTNGFVPPVIYAILSLLTAILVTGLPETKGSDLPDTLLEAETKEYVQKQENSPSVATATTKNHQHQRTTK